jgi:hypothetical protein
MQPTDRNLNISLALKLRMGLLESTKLQTMYGFEFSEQSSWWCVNTPPLASAFAEL